MRSVVRLLGAVVCVVGACSESEQAQPVAPGGAQPLAGSPSAGDGGAADSSGGARLNASAGMAAANGGAPDGGLTSLGGRGSAGEPAEPLPEWQSGSRLRARAVGADGVSLLEGVHDQLLETDCSFTTAGDGAIRCMPGAVVPYYADANCTQLIAPIFADCTTPTHISWIQACKSSGFEVGALVTPDKIYFSGANGCSEIPKTIGQEYHVLSAIADTAFVAGVEVGDPRGGGLEMRYWQSEDGGLFPNAARDTKRGATCSPGRAPFAGQCVPTTTAAFSPSLPTFSDSACTAPVAYLEHGNCNPPQVSAVALRTPDATCNALTISAYAEAEAFTEQAFRSAGPACFKVNLSTANYSFFKQGAALSSSAFPTLTPLLTGSGRLKVRRYETASATLIDSARGFVDSSSGLDCIVEQTEDGLRCMPTNANGVTFYADATCNSPVWLESKTPPDNPACAAPRPTVIYRDVPSVNCGTRPTLELFAVGTLTTPAVLYLLNNGSCENSGTDPTLHNVYATTPGDETTTVALSSTIE